MIAFATQHIFVSLILGIFIIYCGICLGYFLLHRFFIFFPSTKLTQTPSDLGMVFEEKFISTSDKIPLQLWSIPCTANKAKEKTSNFTILFFSGNEGTLSKFLPAMKSLHNAGFNICMFSYRGFGKSGRKRPFEAGLRKDCLAVWEYLSLQQETLPKTILFYGQSIGCALASWTASQCTPAGLILEGAFPSVAEVAKKIVPWLPTRLLTTETFVTQDHLEKCHCPILIAHSTDDTDIPFSFGESLSIAAPEPKSFVILSGTHAKGLEESEPIFTQAIIKFLDFCLQQKNIKDD